jgi:hypothetical protein
LPTFVEAVAALEQVHNESLQVQKAAFRNFVNEFGTHYAATTILGVRDPFFSNESGFAS